MKLCFPGTSNCRNKTRQKTAARRRGDKTTLTFFSQFRQPYLNRTCSTTFTCAGMIFSSLRTSSPNLCMWSPHSGQLCSCSGNSYSIRSLGRSDGNGLRPGFLRSQVIVCSSDSALLLQAHQRLNLRTLSTNGECVLKTTLTFYL